MKTHLTIKIDKASLDTLNQIRKKYNDPSYTHSINRSTTLQNFIDNKLDEGFEIYIEKDDIKEKLILPII